MGPVLGTRPAKPAEPPAPPFPHAKGSQNIPALPGRCCAPVELHSGPWALIQGPDRGGQKAASTSEGFSPHLLFYPQLSGAGTGLSRDTGGHPVTQGHTAGQGQARGRAVCRTPRSGHTRTGASWNLPLLPSPHPSSSRVPTQAGTLTLGPCRLLGTRKTRPPNLSMPPPHPASRFLVWSWVTPRAPTLPRSPPYPPHPGLSGHEREAPTG